MLQRDIMGGLAKGLLAIETFTADRPRQSVSQVAAASGLDRATARRCLLTLSYLGYADYDGKFFTLTPRVLRLGTACLATMPLPQVVQPHLDRLSQEIGESPGRFATLTLIGRNPGISQTELSLANGRDKSSLTPVVEDLVRRGLVQRRRMDLDRRAYRLTLTPGGKKTLALMMRCARQHERVLDRAIGARDRKRFVETLKRIAAAVE